MRQRATRSNILLIIVAAAFAFFNAAPSRADDASKGFAGYTQYSWYHARYDVNPDGTHVETQAWAVKVMSEQGIAEAQQQSISFSDRLQTLHILSAYTLKQDGRKIDVPATNFQNQGNTGNGNAAPMFSDIRTMTVAYPDVAVGDSVVLSYKMTQKEATFPGNFSMLQTFSKFQVYDDVQISLSAPTALALQVYSRGVEGGEAPSSDGRRNWSWSYKNLQMAPPESDSVSTLDYGPLIVASTFKNYAMLAAAYDARARPKAKPTDKIRKLANDLTASAHTPRDQARALYDWVSQNIKYVGNLVGVGAVVPHDADLVLANRMGDCKDHVTLLQALLASKGIASTPTLINADSAYTLPEVAVIDVFDHVINYIPSLDLYADSTSPDAPFGSLPSGDAGKPVVQTIDFKGIQHTPIPKWNDKGSNSSTVMKVHEDGSADGETRFDAKGELAGRARYAMLYMQPNMEDLFMRRVLTSNGFTGTGTIDKGDVNGTADTYGYTAKFRISDAMNLPGPGALSIRSPYDGIGDMTNFISDVNQPDPTVDFLCYGAYAKQELTVELPKGVKVLAVPKNVEIKGKYQTYKATYQFKGSTFSAERELVDRTPGPVCAPAVETEYRKFETAVRKELREQLLYE